MGIFGKIGKWVGDRWGDGPSMKGLQSSVKGTAKFAGKVAVPALLAAGTFGLGPAAGLLGKLGGLAGKIPGAAKAGGLLKGGAGKVADSIFNAGKGAMTKAGGGFDWGKLGKIATAGAGFIGQQQQNNQAQDYMNAEQTRRDEYAKLAMQQQAEMAPLRKMLIERLSKIGSSGGANPMREYLNSDS